MKSLAWFLTSLGAIIFFVTGLYSSIVCCVGLPLANNLESSKTAALVILHSHKEYVLMIHISARLTSTRCDPDMWAQLSSQCHFSDADSSRRGIGNGNARFTETDTNTEGECCANTLEQKHSTAHQENTPGGQIGNWIINYKEPRLSSAVRRGKERKGVKQRNGCIE